MNVKSLENAVRDEIDAFVKNGCEFSAHSITTNIRVKVNSGNLEIDGLPQDQIGGIMTQNIEHQTVRTIVHQLFNSGDIQAMGFDRRWQTSPNANGGYFTYGPVGVGAIPVMPPVASVQNAMTNQPIFTPASPTDPNVVKSVLDYFDHRFADGIPATLHSTQRRLKRTPLSITDIAQIATTNGYRIVTSSPYSESIVTPGTSTVTAGNVSNV